MKIAVLHRLKTEGTSGSKERIAGWKYSYYYLKYWLKSVPQAGILVSDRTFCKAEEISAGLHSCICTNRKGMVRKHKHSC